MSALELLRAVEDTLRSRGHKVTERVALTGSLGLLIDGQFVARTCPEGVQVTAAVVFDGHSHVTPIGCDAQVFEPTKTAHLRAANAIEFRQAERAAAPPVPVDPTAIVRDPPEHECAEDNQGLCHRCGEVLNLGRWAEYQGRGQPQREPVFQLTAPRGSDAWQEGRQFLEIPASELTDEQLGELDASERAIALEWRAANDHEATVHNVEPYPALVAERESDAAFVNRWDLSIETAAE
jgi:hypothetical protein